MHRLPIRTPSGSQVLDTATCEFVPAEPEAPILHSDAHSDLRGTSVRVMYPSLTDLISVLPPPNATIQDLSAIVIAKLPGGVVKRLGFRSQDGEILSQDRLVRDVVRPDELLQAYDIPTVVTRGTRVSCKHTSISPVHWHMALSSFCSSTGA